MVKNRVIYFLFILGMTVFTGCGLVDEDLSDCETNYHLDYELRLVTNMTTELKTQLSTELATDVAVSNALQDYLGNVFTDFAHDVDLGFYDVQVKDPILHRESHIMDANQSSYTLYIPVRKYMHLALANVQYANEGMPGVLMLAGMDSCHTARIVQDVRDTLPSHTAGIFTARLPMDIQEGVDQQFDVRLYMANAASSLVVDTLGSGIKDIRVCMTGFATGFDIRDSVYHFNYKPIVKADRLTIDSPGSVCYACVSFPSPSVLDSKVIIDVDDSSVEEQADHSLWQVKVYSYMQDGTITETVLGVTKPLKPGHFKLIKAKAYSNGTVKPGDPSIAVSVTTDWDSGLNPEVII